MPTIICDFCQYVGNGTQYNERIGDVEDHEKTCKENPDYAEEPEIEECEITDMDGHLHFRYDGISHSIHQAWDHADFIGFKFKDGTIMASPVKYSVPGMTSKGYYASYEDLKTSQALEHHASHVLFRRKKQE